MKILLVTGVYPPRIGGPSAQTKQLAQELVKRGIETRVVTYGDEASESQAHGVPITYLNGSRKGGLVEKFSKNYLTCQRLGEIMTTFRPDVVHQQTAVANLAFYTGAMARRHGIPSILKYSSDPNALITGTPSSSESSQSTRPSSTQLLSQHLRTRKQKLLFSLYDSVWATTPEFESRLVDRFRVPPTKVLLRPNFIDLGKFQKVAESRLQPASENRETPDVRSRKILTVARLEPFKGVDLCIRAMAHLKELPVTLSIVGDGSESYVSHLHDLVRELRLEDRVEFLGSIPPAKIHEQYANSDVFALASTYEAFGIVLVEAMAAGVPVAATKVGGIPEVVGDDGLLVSSQDVAGLAGAMRHLLEDPDAHQEFVRRGQKRAMRFGLEVGCDRMLEHYTTLADSGSRS